MDRFKNHLLALAVLSVLAVIGTIMNSHQAAAQGPPDGMAVKIVNSYMESDLFKELTQTRGALGLTVSVIRKVRAGQKVDSAAALKVMARALTEARETARKHKASARFGRHERN
jgi:hypothetical protein